MMMINLCLVRKAIKEWVPKKTKTLGREEGGGGGLCIKTKDFGVKPIDWVEENKKKWNWKYFFHFRPQDTVISGKILKYKKFPEDSSKSHSLDMKV